MNVRDMIFLNTKKLVRKKSNLINILLLTITGTCVFLGFSINASLNQYWENCTDNIVEYRTLSVFPTYDHNMPNSDRIDKLKQYKHVEAVESPDARIISVEIHGMKKKKEQMIDIIGTVDTPVNIIKGEDMSKYNKENVLICPQRFYPYVQEEIDEYSKNRIIDLSDKVGSTITISPLGSKDKIDFKIVGIYDTTLTNSRGDSCYAKFSTVKRLNQKYQKEVFEETESFILPNIVVIDNVRNVDGFIKSITNDGMVTTGAIKEITVDTGDKIMQVIKVLSISVLIISVIISILIEIKDYEYNKKNYGILKTIGYKNKEIIKINDVKYIIMILISFVFTFIIGIFILLWFHKIYLSEQVMLQGIEIQLSFTGLFISLFINMLIMLFLSFIIKSKLEKQDTLNLLKEL